MPSANRNDYKSDAERVKGYNDALQNYQGDNYASFMDQYGHLLDDDDEMVPGQQNIGQISNMVQELGKGQNIEQLMALADDDDELDLFMN